jgi:integrase/recombinase XerD
MTPGGCVAPVNLPYLSSDKDRHGTVRWYVRAPGMRKVRIRGVEGSEEFLRQYWQARNGEAPESKPAKRSRAERGTFGFLVEHYYASKAFRDLDAVYTRVERRRQLDPLVEKIGSKAALMPVAIIRQAVRDRENAAARKWLAAVRDVYRVAVEDALVPRDPTLGVKVKKPRTAGFHSWTLEDCLAYETRHPIGTPARTAYAIGLYLGCRRSDAVRIGRAQERNNGTQISYTQHKGRGRAPVEIVQPIVPPLREALNGWQAKGFFWLGTAFGKQRSDKAFGGLFASWCREAGLPPGRSFHGLRKALAARLAEQGYSTNQIGAVLGDKTLQQAEVYTRAAARQKMADDALSGLFGAPIVPLSERVARGGTKRGKNV